jgi:hypothetical protein
MMWRTGREGGLTRGIDVSLDDMLVVSVYFRDQGGTGDQGSGKTLDQGLEDLV